MKINWSIQLKLGLIFTISNLSCEFFVLKAMDGDGKGKAGGWEDSDATGPTEEEKRGHMSSGVELIRAAVFLYMYNTSGYIIYRMDFRSNTNVFPIQYKIVLASGKNKIKINVNRYQVTEPSPNTTQRTFINYFFYSLNISFTITRLRFCVSPHLDC